MGSLRACLSSPFISRVNATIHTVIAAATSNASPLHRSCADYSCKWDCSTSQQFTTERASNTPILPAFLFFPPICGRRRVGPGLFRNFSCHQPGVRSFPGGNIRRTSSGIQSDQIFVSLTIRGTRANFQMGFANFANAFARVCFVFRASLQNLEILVRCWLKILLFDETCRERSDLMRLNIGKG